MFTIIITFQTFFACPASYSVHQCEYTPRPGINKVASLPDSSHAQTINKPHLPKK